MGYRLNVPWVSIGNFMAPPKHDLVILGDAQLTTRKQLKTDGQIRDIRLFTIQNNHN